MKLYDVSLSLLLEAEDEDDAIDKAEQIINGDRKLDCNIMIHNAETDPSHKDLKELREKREEEE